MYDRILVPTDGSDGFDRVAGEAIGLAALADATVHALYVIDPRAVDYEPSPEARETVESELRATGEEATAAVADLAANRGVDVERVVRVGIPHREILDYADEVAADLIAMGTQGRTGLDRLLLGSVAERVVRMSDRPVVTVNLGEAERAVADEEAAVDAAAEALEAEGHELREVREDPYREASTWVVPVTTADGERFNVHVNAVTGEARAARVG